MGGRPRRVSRWHASTPVRRRRRLWPATRDVQVLADARAFPGDRLDRRHPRAVGGRRNAHLVPEWWTAKEAEPPPHKLRDTRGDATATARTRRQAVTPGQPNRSYVAVTVSFWTSTPFTRMETVHTPGVDDSWLFHNQ